MMFKSRCQFLDVHYGKLVVTNFKLFSNQVQLAKCVNQKIFLLKCRQNNVTPKHLNLQTFRSIQFNNRKNLHQYEQIICKFEKSILNGEIKDIHNTVKNIQNNIRVSQEFTTNNLRNNIYKNFFELECKKSENIFQ